jgi:hypothetical protein
VKKKLRMTIRYVGVAAAALLAAAPLIAPAAVQASTAGVVVSNGQQQPKDMGNLYIGAPAVEPGKGLANVAGDDSIGLTSGVLAQLLKDSAAASYVNGDDATANQRPDLAAQSEQGQLNPWWEAIREDLTTNGTHLVDMNQGDPDTGVFVAKGDFYQAIQLLPDQSDEYSSYQQVLKQLPDKVQGTVTTMVKSEKSGYIGQSNLYALFNDGGGNLGAYATFWLVRQLNVIPKPTAQLTYNGQALAANKVIGKDVPFTAADKTAFTTGSSVEATDQAYQKMVQSGALKVANGTLADVSPAAIRTAAVQAGVKFVSDNSKDPGYNTYKQAGQVFTIPVTVKNEDGQSAMTVKLQVTTQTLQVAWHQGNQWTVNAEVGDTVPVGTLTKNLGVTVNDKPVTKPKFQVKDQSGKVITGNLNTQQAGDQQYTVSYTYDDGTNPAVTITHVVILKVSKHVVPPVIVAKDPVFTFDTGFVKDQTVTQGGSFDETAGIHAWTDADQTTPIPSSDWQITGQVNTQTPGVYHLTYTITNPVGGHTAQLQRQITVAAKLTEQAQQGVVKVTNNAGAVLYTNPETTNAAGRTLSRQSSWRYFGVVRDAAGQIVAYDLGGHQYVKAVDVAVPASKPQNGVFTVRYPAHPKWAIAVCDDTLHTQKLIAAGSIWQTYGSEKLADGHSYYNLGGHQWVRTDYGYWHTK